MKLKFRTVGAMLVPVAALTFALAASGSPQRAASAQGNSLPSCYPNNEYTVWTGFGAFSGSSAGTMAGGGGDATWSFSAKVTGNKDQDAGSPFQATPGSISGNVTATLHVPGVAHAVKFIPTCIQEAYGSNENRLIGTQQLGSFRLHARFEGHVDLPPWNPGNDLAILSIDVAHETCDGGSPIGSAPDVPACADGGLTPLPVAPGAATHVTVTLRHALTCDVLPGSQYKASFTSHMPDASLKVKYKGQGENAFRWRTGLPSGFVAHANQVCPGINYGD